MKGLYAKQAAGEITGLTGVDDPYEAPESPGPADRVAHRRPCRSPRPRCTRCSPRGVSRDDDRRDRVSEGTDSPYALSAPGRPGVRGGAHLPRGGGRVRAAGDPLLRRQGLHRHAAPGAEGVRARAGAVLAAARGHRAQLPRGPGVPRPRRSPSTGCGCMWPPCRTTSTRGKLTRAPRRHPQPAADRAADRDDPGRALRRRVRRRPPRRGEGPRQGAGLLAARRVLPVGPAPPAPRAVAAVQRPARARRARPGLPAVQLDRAGRLAVHRPRGHRAAGDLLRPRARGLPARRHVADRRRVGRPQGRRDRSRRGRSATAPSATCPAPAPSTPTPPRSTP